MKMDRNKMHKSVLGFSVPQKLLFFLALFFTGFTFAAALDVFDYPLSAETLPQYTIICNRLSEHPLIKGTFEQTKTIKRLGRSLNSKGNFIIAAELGMVWDTLSPFPSLMAVGRDFIIQTGPGGTKSKLDAQGNETFISLADTISAVFSGNSRILRDKFENYFFQDTESGSWTLGLVPRDEAVRVFADRIILGGENLPAHIKTIVIYSRNGDLISYSLENHRFPGELDDHEKAFFSF